MRCRGLFALLMSVAALLTAISSDARAGIDFVEVSTEFSINPSEQNPVPLSNFDPDIAPVAQFDQGTSAGALFAAIGRAYSTPPSAWGLFEGQYGSVEVDRRALVFEMTFFAAVSGLESRGAGDGVATATVRGRSGRTVSTPILIFQDGRLIQIAFDGDGVPLPDLGGTHGSMTLFSFVPIGAVEFRHRAPAVDDDEREPTMLTIDSLRIPAIVRGGSRPR